MKKKLLTTIPVVLVLLLGGCIGTKGGLKNKPKELVFHGHLSMATMMLPRQHAEP